jgi:integrative and conjugative element protein (TIGR02256 family)
LRLRNADISLTIEADDKLLERLVRVGRNRYPKEFGGILIGYYSNDQKTVNIKKTLLPKKYQSTKYSFERGNDGLKSELEKLYHQTPALLYVGEWHTHPDNPAIPSVIDIAALQQISDDDNVLISNPILLIIGIDQQRAELCFYVYFKNKIYKYGKESE